MSSSTQQYRMFREAYVAKAGAIQERFMAHQAEALAHLRQAREPARRSPGVCGASIAKQSSSATPGAVATDAAAAPGSPAIAAAPAAGREVRKHPPCTPEDLFAAAAEGRRTPRPSVTSIRRGH